MSFSQLTVHLVGRKALSFDTVLTSNAEIISANSFMQSEYAGFMTSALFIFHCRSFSLKQMRSSKVQRDYLYLTAGMMCLSLGEDKEDSRCLFSLNTSTSLRLELVKTGADLQTLNRS